MEPGDEWVRSVVKVTATARRSLELMRLELQVSPRYETRPPKVLELILDLQAAKQLLNCVQANVDYLESSP